MILLTVTALLSISRASFFVADASSTVSINTNDLTLTWQRKMVTLQGVTEDRAFTYGNMAWNYQVAVYNLNSSHSDMFAFGNNVDVQGKKAVLIIVTGDLLVNTTIDVSAVAVSSSLGKFHLGGFALPSSNCCYVGAGPGAGFTFHGGGHGGVGGGSWIDTQAQASYGKSYNMLGHLIGGSTGAFIYDSNPGSGGGAISFEATGTLTIGSMGRILANGYNVKNTTYPACSGGSAGGKIKLKATNVVIHGELSVNGGNSGFTSNYSDYCGDGGGGGIIDITSSDISFSNPSAVHYNGGRGLENGLTGLLSLLSNLSGLVEIHTTTCQMDVVNASYKKTGTLTHKLVSIDCHQWNITECTFVFDGTVNFHSSATLIIKGEHALKIVAKRGNIVVETKFDMSAKNSGSYVGSKTILGGFNNLNGNNPGPGSKINSAGHGYINDARSYGIWPVLLLGGSSCTNQSLALAFGGGVLIMEAKQGSIIVDANISADAYTDAQNSKCGASGGTVILDAINVTINAFVTANGGDGELEGGSGGVVKVSKKNDRILVNAGVGRIHGGNVGTILDENSNHSALDPPARSCNLSPSVTNLETTSVLGTGESLSFENSAISNMTSFTSMASFTTMTSFTTVTSFTVMTSPTIMMPSTTSTVGVFSSEEQTTMLSSTLPKSSEVSPTPSSPSQTMHSSAFIKKDDVVSEQFKQFVGAKVNSSSAMNISSNLANALKSSSTLSSQDIKVAMNIIGQLSNSSVYLPKDASEGRAVTVNMVSSCSKMAKLNFENQDKRETTLVPDIARSLEDFGESISTVIKTEEIFLVKDDTIALEVTNINKKFPRDRFLPLSRIAIKKEDNVIIPKDVFTSVHGNVSVIFVLININSTYNQSVHVNGSRVQTISNIVSVRLGGEKLQALVRPIVIRNKLQKELKENHIARGGFWKVNSNNNNKNSQDGWSYAGCSSENKGSYVETKCNHMTSFAVLMSFREEELASHHKHALGLITYTGCGISLFGLLMTFAAYVTLDNLDPERAAIHTNLVVALGIAQIIFLAGINATKSKPACTTVAVLLHYFFTAAFSWMFAEGIHLYKKVVSVFAHGSKIKFYYVVGWGLPIIIVAISAGIRPDGYGTDTACWISIEGGLIWAFVVPVIVVIIINFIILILVVRILVSSVSTIQVDSKTSQETNTSVKQLKAGAKAMVILMPILGLSWIFGILAVNEATLVFQYLFCIFNSLQGLFIFIIYVVGNSEVRSAVKRLQEKHTLSRSVGERSFALKSVAKKSKTDSPKEDILVQREIGSWTSSPYAERVISPKTLSAGQISLNSLNCPTPPEYTY